MPCLWNTTGHSRAVIAQLPVSSSCSGFVGSIDEVILRIVFTTYTVSMWVVTVPVSCQVVSYLLHQVYQLCHLGLTAQTPRSLVNNISLCEGRASADSSRW